jgi:hypothetical protein
MTTMPKGLGAICLDAVSKAAVLAATLVFFAPLIVHAAPELLFTTKIFAADSNKQKLLFTARHDAETISDTMLGTTVYSDPNGKVVARETMEFAVSGSDRILKRYRLEQLQLASDGTVEIKGNTAHFSYTNGGKTKTSDEKIGDDFVVGPSLLGYLDHKWPDILAGKKVGIRFGVLDRLESVGFELFKEKETEIDGKKAVAIKMKPSNFIIAAVVDPLTFFFSPDGKTLMELHGRVPVKKLVDGKYKDLDAVTVYTILSKGTPTAATPAGTPTSAPKNAADQTGNSK